MRILNDHDELRHDPVLAILARQACGEAVGLRATGGQVDMVNRLGAEPTDDDTHHKVSYDPSAIERLFVDVFLESASTGAGADRSRPRCHG